MTTEFRVDGFEGSGGGLEGVFEVAVVDVELEEDIFEMPGVAERAGSDVSHQLYSRNRISERRM